MKKGAKRGAKRRAKREQKGSKKGDCEQPYYDQSVTFAETCFKEKITRV
jgi:hypothetical protein